MASVITTKELYEPEGMKAVREKYEELNGVVFTFNEKVGDVLSRAEVQFLQAYRAHMQSVHRERLELEAKLKQAEMQQASDTQIRALERDREWYLTQKRELEAKAAAMQKDLLYLEEKTEVISHDREKLSRQLKAVKKSQRLELADEQEFLMRQRRAEEERAGHRAPTGGSVAGAANGGGGGGQPGSRGGGIWANSGAASPGAVSGSFGGGGGGGAGGEAEGEEVAELRRELREEKAALAGDRAEVQRLRGLVVADRSLRADLEEFFLQAVEDLRRDGERARRREAGGGGGGGGAGSASPVRPGAVLVDAELEADLTVLFDSLFPVNPAKT